METERHVNQMLLLIESLNLAWSDRNDFYCCGNMFVYWSELQVKRNDFRGPDVFVVLGTEKKERLSWVVWQEGGKTPDVVIELISPSTEDVDRGKKMRIYAEVLHVGEYYLFDPMTAELQGYELDATSHSYRPIQPDGRGYLPCKQLGLWLGVVRGKFGYEELPLLRWIDSAGRVLPSGYELAADQATRAAEEATRAAEEARRADQEASARRAAEARIAELEAELRRRGA